MTDSMQLLLLFVLVLVDLQYRLENKRPLTPPLEGIQQQYGINSNLLNNITQFWLMKYNFREQEKFLNQFPQYITSIQGLDIHYIHVRPKLHKKKLKVATILLLHGWPSSVREFYGIIPHLTTPQKDETIIFEVIAPSLPGFIFSDGAMRPGLGATQMAVVLKNLMVRLGRNRFFVHGGDIGAVIAQHMAILYPQHVEGFHSNLCLSFTPMASIKLHLGSFYPSLVVDEKHQNKVYPLTETFYKTYLMEKGYTHIQATKPDTMGVALNDSPVGLAAYILEKFITWTDKKWMELEDGGLEMKFSYTELIDNIMMYWLSHSMTTAMRFYADTLNREAMILGMDLYPILIPSACSRYANDYYYFPDAILNEKFHNLVYTADYDDIGHFAALETPKIFAEDLYNAVKRMLPEEETKNKTSKS